MRRWQARGGHIERTGGAEQARSGNIERTGGAEQARSGNLERTGGAEQARTQLFAKCRIRRAESTPLVFPLRR